MSDTAEDFIRREVGRFLRVDYRGKFMCASCLLKLTLESHLKSAGLPA